MRWSVTVRNPKAADYDAGARASWLIDWWLTLVVYDDLPSLNKAMARYSADRYGDPRVAVPEDEYAAGCFQPREPHQRRGRGDLGILRLAKGHLGSFIVVHECAHAATTLYRRLFDSDEVNLGRECGSEEEERFCRGLGEISAQVVNALYALGAYDDGTPA